MKYFVLFSLLVLLSCSWGIEECVVDEDCAAGYRCFEGKCIEVICPIGYTVENHSCVYTSIDSSIPESFPEDSTTDEETEPAEEPEPEIVEEPAEEIEEPAEEPEIDEIEETTVTEESNETKETIEEEITGEETTEQGTSGEIEESEDGIGTILLLIGIIIIGSAIVVYMTYFKKIR